MFKKAIFSVCLLILSGAALVLGSHIDAQTFNYTGLQTSLTVTQSGLYDIMALGARGGGNGFSPLSGGAGASIDGSISLTFGTVLQIVVGGAGIDANNNFAGGGGGGSFIFIMGAPQPLLVAGGGGGSVFTTIIGGNYVGGNGQTTTSGQNSMGFLLGLGGAGGINGLGGEGGGNSGGGGGGGWSGDSADVSLDFFNGKGGKGPPTFAGGAGGLAPIPPNGGFGGGGGGGFNSGGGGGGYSGGGGGIGPVEAVGGGGGGSFSNMAFSNIVFGTNTNNDGMVTVRLLTPSSPVPEPGLNALLACMTLVGTCIFARRRTRK